MAYAKKYSRRIVVGGRSFRWKASLLGFSVTAEDNSLKELKVYFESHHDSLRPIVEAPERKGTNRVSEFGEGTAVTSPKVVAAAIEWAIAYGWLDAPSLKSALHNEEGFCWMEDRGFHIEDLHPDGYRIIQRADPGAD